MSICFCVRTLFIRSKNNKMGKKYSDIQVDRLLEISCENSTAMPPQQINNKKAIRAGCLINGSLLSIRPAIQIRKRLSINTELGCKLKTPTFNISGLYANAHSRSEEHTSELQSRL